MIDREERKGVERGWSGMTNGVEVRRGIKLVYKAAGRTGRIVSAQLMVRVGSKGAGGT